MGNQLIKNYDVEKEPSCSGGQNQLWKIYSAVKQDSTKRKVSIWMFDKKGIKDKHAIKNKDEIAQFLKKEANSLVKIRHPNIVNIVEPLVEDKDTMAFVTERVDENLESLMMKNEYNLICQSELELKLQVESLLKVLSFLHNDVKMAHLGLSPENIFLVNGQWKLAGFTFSTSLQNAQSANNTQDIHSNPCVAVSNADYTKRTFDSFCQFFPNLSFSAPEVAEIPPKCNAASDVFSLGLLLLLMFQIKYMQTTSVTPALNSRHIGEYSHQLANLPNHFKTQNYIQKDMSDNFKKLITKMLAKNTATRPTIEQIKQSPWLNDPFVKAIYMLENIVEFDQHKQIAFLTGMSNILFKYEKFVIKNRILPQLLDLAKFEYLIPAILGVIIDCLKQPELFTIAEFQAALAPFVLDLTKRKSIPGKALCSLVMNCETFHRFFSQSDFQNIYLVPVFKCFDIPQLQAYALEQSCFLISKLDYIITKNKLLPKILALCTSNNPKIMKHAVLTLQKIIGNLDKNVLNDSVLSTLEKLRKMPVQDKSLTMLILDIYQTVAKSLDIQVIAQKILPNLIPYLIDQTLGQKEFNVYLTAVNAMIKQIEIERIKQIKEIELAAGDANGNGRGGGMDEDLLFNGDKSTTIDSSSTSSQNTSKNTKEFDFLSMFEEKQQAQPESVSNPTVNSAIQQKQQLDNKVPSTLSIPAKQSVLQMDFNFDMFDNPSEFNNNQSNIKNGTASNTVNANGNTNFPIKDVFPNNVYKDPFESLKVAKTIDPLFLSQPKQPDFFNNFKDKELPGSAGASNFIPPSQGVSSNLTNNSNKSNPINSIANPNSISNSQVPEKNSTNNSSSISTIKQQPNNSSTDSNSAKKQLSTNLKQQQQQQPSASTNASTKLATPTPGPGQLVQPYPPGQQQKPTAWSGQEDIFKDLMCTNNLDMDTTTQQSLNVSSMNLLTKQQQNNNNNNINNNNNPYNDDLFGGLESVNQTMQNLFSGTQKNSSEQQGGSPDLSGSKSKNSYSAMKNFEFF